ncbi:hypothetical protein [Gluconacetobacter takamatsuzukensis]|uniref:Uncharacterized protein n=1 Tax=Gluconacetobacter takamatsuzukensis TaxID=1286190 RepID=A0A7W4KD56_9PROT|nr:hypothetical protein [Gluconacetobacter takamatsuzukensis]MBB2204733.1 hypothetical protein [Gluconacetobacter takamatsuzukensis]
MLHRLRSVPTLMAVSALCVTGLAGCDLVDQRTFDARASRPPVPHYPPPPPAPRPVPPLVDIRAGTPDSQWRPALDSAVARALARKPNVLFVVRVVVPAGPTPEQEAQAMRQAVASYGQAVAAAIVAAGARPEQVEMAAMSDSSMTTGAVRVYVR